MFWKFPVSRSGTPCVWQTHANRSMAFLSQFLLCFELSPFRSAMLEEPW